MAELGRTGVTLKVFDGSVSTGRSYPMTDDFSR